jgi:hypothetical protein
MVAGKQFDPPSRCLIYQGDLVAHDIGLAEEIVEEIRSAGFHILGWRVDPRRDLDDQDTLLIVATLPENFPSN